MTPSPPKPTSDSTATQIHADNIELSVYSCWTAKRLLRAKVVDAKVDPKGKYITIDIDDDETAKPEFNVESKPDTALADLNAQKEVEAYALSMEDKLRENDYKGGWKDCPTDYLIDKLLEETTELIACFKGNHDLFPLKESFETYLSNSLGDGGDKTEEAADVGNVVMMLADPERIESAPTKATEGAEGA